VLTAVGLVAALVGDGAWDAVSWAALAAPLVEVGRRVVRRRAPDGRRARAGAAGPR
jgi:membrane protein implicated in regulation of membrane protease activity